MTEQLIVAGASLAGLAVGFALALLAVQVTRSAKLRSPNQRGDDA